MWESLPPVANANFTSDFTGVAIAIEAAGLFHEDTGADDDTRSTSAHPHGSHPTFPSTHEFPGMAMTAAVPTAAMPTLATGGRPPTGYSFPSLNSTPQQLPYATGSEIASLSSPGPVNLGGTRAPVAANASSSSSASAFVGGATAAFSGVGAAPMAVSPPQSFTFAPYTVPNAMTSLSASSTGGQLASQPTLTTAIGPTSFTGLPTATSSSNCGGGGAAAPPPLTKSGVLPPIVAGTTLNGNHGGSLNTPLYHHPTRQGVAKSAEGEGNATAAGVGGPVLPSSFYPPQDASSARVGGPPDTSMTGAASREQPALLPPPTMATGNTPYAEWSTPQLLPPREAGALPATANTNEASGPPMGFGVGSTLHQPSPPPALHPGASASSFFSAAQMPSSHLYTTATAATDGSTPAATGSYSSSTYYHSHFPPPLPPPAPSEDAHTSNGGGGGSGGMIGGVPPVCDAPSAPAASPYNAAFAYAAGTTLVGTSGAQDPLSPSTLAVASSGLLPSVSPHALSTSDALPSPRSPRTSVPGVPPRSTSTTRSPCSHVRSEECLASVPGTGAPPPLPSVALSQPSPGTSFTVTSAMAPPPPLQRVAGQPVASLSPTSQPLLISPRTAPPPPQLGLPTSAAPLAPFASSSSVSTSLSEAIGTATASDSARNGIQPLGCTTQSAARADDLSGQAMALTAPHALRTPTPPSVLSGNRMGPSSDAPLSGRHSPATLFTASPATGVGCAPPCTSTPPPFVSRYGVSSQPPQSQLTPSLPPASLEPPKASAAGGGGSSGSGNCREAASSPDTFISPASLSLPFSPSQVAIGADDGSTVGGHHRIEGSQSNGSVYPAAERRARIGATLPSLFSDPANATATAVTPSAALPAPATQPAILSAPVGPAALAASGLPLYSSSSSVPPPSTVFGEGGTTTAGSVAQSGGAPLSAPHPHVYQAPPPPQQQQQPHCALPPTAAQVVNPFATAYAHFGNSNGGGGAAASSLSPSHASLQLPPPLPPPDGAYSTAGEGPSLPPPTLSALAAGVPTDGAHPVLSVPQALPTVTVVHHGVAGAAGAAPAARASTSSDHAGSSPLPGVLHAQGTTGNAMHFSGAGSMQGGGVSQFQPVRSLSQSTPQLTSLSPHRAVASAAPTTTTTTAGAGDASPAPASAAAVVNLADVTLGAAFSTTTTGFTPLGAAQRAGTATASVRSLYDDHRARTPTSLPPRTPTAEHLLSFYADTAGVNTNLSKSFFFERAPELANLSSQVLTTFPTEADAAPATTSAGSAAPSPQLQQQQQQQQYRDASSQQPSVMPSPSSMTHTLATTPQPQVFPLHGIGASVTVPASSSSQAHPPRSTTSSRAGESTRLGHPSPLEGGEKGSFCSPTIAGNSFFADKMTTPLPNMSLGPSAAAAAAAATGGAATTTSGVPPAVALATTRGSSLSSSVAPFAGVGLGSAIRPLPPPASSSSMAASSSLPGVATHPHSAPRSVAESALSRSGSAHFTRSSLPLPPQQQQQQQSAPLLQRQLSERVASYFKGTGAPPTRTSVPTSSSLLGKPQPSPMPTAVDTAASALPRSGGGEAPYAGYAAYRVAPPGPSATTAVSPPASVQPCVELDELERTVNAFQARFDSYKVFKNSCTESYLGEIEQAVDQFLVMHYNPNNGTGEHGSYGAGGGPTDRRGSQTPAMGTAMTNLTKAGAKLLYLLKGGSSGGGSASIPGGSGMTTPAPAPSSRSPSTSTTMTAASAGQPPMVNPFQAKSPSASVLPPGVHSSVTPSSSVNNASGVMVPASAPPPPPQPQSSAASFRYTPDVIPAHYLDEPPSSAVMQSIRLNYPAILHALRHVLPSAHHTHGAPLQASPETASMASPVFEESEHLLFRNELLVPIIRRVWRDHLHPLERKVKELLWVCDNQVIPPFRTHRHAHLMSGGSNDGNGNGDSSAAAVAVSAFATGDGDHGAAFCAVNPTTALAQQQYEETRQTGVEQRVERMRRLLIGDEEYISTIRAMDEEFVSESHSTGSLRGAEDPHRLSDYVPVYGLVLSRLHRLEMEHRTVLEMWGNRRSASSVSQPRWA